MFKKRGQSAMEFLMTYGWAILVVLIVLGGLYYLGVFSPKTVNTYSIKAPMLIQDLAVRDNGVLFKMSSNLVESASVSDVKINGQSCSTLNGFLYNTQISGVTYTGCAVDLSDYNKVSGTVEVTYTSKSGLSHEISGSYSGRVEEGNINDIIEESNNGIFHLGGSGLVFGWDGESNNDYVNNIPGTIHGGVDVGDVDGYVGKGTGFDGNVNDYINFGNPASLNFGGGSFTYSLWFYEDSAIGPWDIPIYKGGSSRGSLGFDMELGSASWNACIDVMGEDTQCISFGLERNRQWIYLTVVRNAGNNQILSYVNGLPSSNRVGNTGSVSSDIPLHIPGISSGPSIPPHTVNGIIDEVHIWNRALSSEEVLNLYNSYSHP